MKRIYLLLLPVIAILAFYFNPFHLKNNSNQSIDVANSKVDHQTYVANLDPNTKYNILEGTGSSRRNVKLSDDSAIIEYLRYEPFIKTFITNSNGVTPMISLNFVGQGKTKYDPTYFYFTGACGLGLYSFKKEIYDNSRIIHLVNHNRWPNGDFKKEAGKSLDVTLFSNGTIMVNVKSLMDYCGASNLTGDTSKFWTLDK